MSDMSVTATESPFLSRDECMRHLAAASLGRVVVSARALPAVIPVRFSLVGGERIVFWAQPKDHPEAITDNTVLGFQADDIDSATHEGWSVVVVGMASHVRDPAEIAALEGATPRGWSAGDGPLVSLSLDLVNGRRLARPDVTEV
jgi:nitroimidazol reductase NimA-like FMN-containing flavoprotein (pyridoxamine 5'-phosphate oxidase superfamily)